MSDSDRDRVGTRLLVRTNNEGMVTMTMFNADGEELGAVTMDTAQAQNLVNELGDELEDFRSPTLANMRCVGTA